MSSRRYEILPRVRANHPPGSETRWQEETNVRSRVDRVDRLCIELRNRTFFVAQNVRPRADQGINTKATPESLRCEPRTVSTCWNATSKVTRKVSRQGGHRSRRPEACRSRDDAGTRESLIVSCCSQSRTINGAILRGSPPRYQSSHRGKARGSAGSIHSENAETTGTRGRASTAKEPGISVRQS